MVCRWHVSQFNWQSCVNKPTCKPIYPKKRSVRIHRSPAVTEVLKMLPEACGLGQHFQARGHSFSLYGPPSQPITYINYIYVVGQNEIQVKMKFLCLLTLVIHGSWIIRVRRQKKLRILFFIFYFILICHVHKQK